MRLHKLPTLGQMCLDLSFPFGEIALQDREQETVLLLLIWKRIATQNRNSVIVTAETPHT